MTDVMTAADIAATGFGASSPLIERLAREGDALPTLGVRAVVSNPASASVSGSGYGIGSLSVPPPGRALYVRQVTISASHLMQGHLLMSLPGIAGIGTPPVSDTVWLSGGGATDTKTFDTFFRSSDQYAGACMSAAVNVFIDTTGVSVAGTPTVYASVGYVGFMLADDLNFSAAKTILVLGDSRNTGTGPSTIDLHPGAVIKNFYRGQGIDARYILKAYSGSTLQGHATKARRGEYDGFGALALIVVDLGTNDAAQSRTTAASIADLTTIVQWKQRFQPKAKLLVLGSPPMQDNTFEANMATLRAAEAAYVGNLADQTVVYFGFGNAFDRTVAANYLAADGAAGTRIHPIDAGLTQMFDGGYNGYIGLRAWLLANLSSI